MKTQLSATKIFRLINLKIILLILFSISIKPANALLSSLGLSSPTATLDPMSGGTITTLVGTSQDDAASAVTSIGFTFTLNGTSYTQFSVNSNGLMRLGATIISNTATNSLATSTDLPKIAPYWDNLKTVGGTVRSKVLGTAPSRTLVVDWNVSVVSPLSAIRFQVWLFEGSNNIQFVYGAGIPTSTSLYSVGLGTSLTDFSSITVASTFASSTVNTVSANNSNTLVIGASNSFLYMPAPSCPVQTTPASLATNVSTTTSLNWTAGTTGTTTLYDVSFGTAVSPGVVSANQAGITYNPGTLLNNTDYFWKIVGKNGTIAVAQSSGCTIRQFTTLPLPSCATIVSPDHLATDRPLQDTLKWTAGAGPVPTSYDVYFGTDPLNPAFKTNQAGLTYFPGFLAFNTQYYWKIVPHNGSDLAVGCTINTFTTRAPLNYNVTRSTGVAYSSISATGTSVASWKNGTATDDNLSNSIPIGFNFTYDGGTYSSFLVGVNGFITLNVGTTSIGSTSAPYGYVNGDLSGGTPSSPLMIAPFYDDITCQGGQTNIQINLDNGIKYTTTGLVGSRILTVEWIGMETFGTGGPNLNFQVKLFEGTNVIDFVYGTMAGFDGTFDHTYSYSCGINATKVSTTAQVGEYFNQKIANTRSFGTPASSQLNSVPECNSKLRFTSGVYTPYVPVSLVPSNDSISTPIHLNVNATPCIDLCGTNYKSALATKSRDATCGVSNPVDDDVWFDFVAINANTTVRVAGSGAYDAVLEVFNNSMTSIACINLVGVGLTEVFTSSSLVVGQTYIIRVYHSGSGSGIPGSGEFSICVSGIPVPPINDNCASSITLPISPTLVSGSNTFAATASPGIPSCGLPNGENPDDDVWYNFTALKAIEVITVSGNNGFDAVIQLFSGSCGSLASIGCLNTYSNGQVEVLTASGLSINSVYFVRVFHKGIGGGSGSYSISVSSPPPVCTDLVLPPNGELNMSSSGIDLIWDPIVGADNYIIKFDTINPPVRTLTTTTDTSVFTGFLKQTETYYWKIIPGNGNSYNNSCELDSFSTEETPIALKVRVFLQNLYLTNRTMKNLINPADTIADTIMISLYDDINEWQYGSIALLSTNGWATGYFPLLALDSPYYFVISHRNSVEAWSSTQFTLTGDSTFDFATSPSAVWGGNTVQVEPGTYALHCGDMNQDGYIDKADVAQVGAGAALFEIGYYLEDFNADSLVESLDLSQLENKVPLLITKRTPFPPFGP